MNLARDTTTRTQSTQTTDLIQQACVLVVNRFQEMGAAAIGRVC